ncbi:NADP-dependent oxidoreductase [Peribacillus frigoritolerans]|uniref:NADP-dependent oxidoreductase n=1 Tax=Peribacillus frigoritolerans TaxID=450367 RepID=UPI001059A76E|nr:NADP-dependent oxidoreductase [Peribacillus frigoritolerans]TDL79168.1 NADP-dependent oxidoreductase [Peribacillus frigoritolerans]
MKAMAIKKYGKNQKLMITEAQMPAIGEKDVLVEIYASSINPIDFKIRDGKVRTLLTYKMPLVLGNDFSGKVIKTGEKVTAFKTGDSVYGRPRKTRIGTFAEYISTHEEDLSLMPENLSFTEAASLPLVGLTAWQAFHDILKLKNGQKILIHAGAGGLGTFAIQLAKQMGAYVAVTASEKGHHLAESLGADLIVNYKKEKFNEVLNDYDAVFDTLGGEALQKSFEVLKPGGKIVSVSGVPDASYAKDHQMGIVKSVLFWAVSRKLISLAKKHDAAYQFLFMKPSGDQLRLIKELVETGKIRPVIDRTYSFQDTQAALDYVETGRAKGKVIVEVKQ